MKRTAPSHRRATPRGFSLLETVVVVAIIGILSTFAVSGFVYGSRRAKASNATFEVQALFSVATLRATTQGRPQYLAFWQNAAGAFGVQLLDYTPGGTPPAWSGMAPGAAGSSFTVIDQVRFNRTGALRDANIALADLSTAKLGIPHLKLLTSYPAPYQAVRMTGSGGSKDLSKACSFCVDQGGGSLGVLRFNVSGTLDVLTGPSTAGGSLGLQIAREDTATALSPRILAFSSPLSTVRVYE